MLNSRTFARTYQMHTLPRHSSSRVIYYQYTSLFCELVHLWFYKHNGSGLFVADLSSELLEGLSQSVISFVLICLASGWTLVDSEADDSRANSVATLLRNPQRLFQGANIVVVVLIALVAGSMVLQVLNKGFDDDFSKFHDHESKPGKVLVFIRCLLGVAFVTSLGITIKVCVCLFVCLYVCICIQPIIVP
jgi:hypothetical protein